jgi:hypothetical protein
MIIGQESNKSKVSGPLDGKIISKDNLSMLETYISSIEYGSVTIKIQNRKIVLIEKNEKIKV